MLKTQQLAIDGGTPVRDTAANPWPNWPQVSEGEWRDRLEPAMRSVYESTTEGLGGAQAQAFAQEFADYCGVKHARLLVHGTDAIAAALTAALDLDTWGPGPEVIVPNYTYIASASAPLDRRCPVVFADVDERTFTLDPRAVEAAITPRTGAILPVHLGGHPADMDAINAIAQRHGLAVIEDCAQAHAAQHTSQHDGGNAARMVGSVGTAGAFSFQSSKNLTSGEGGAVTTNDPDLDARVHGFMNAGRHPQGERWQYPRVGWNYRPSDYVAALLRVRLGDLEAQSEHRSAMADYLADQLAQHVPGVTPPFNAGWCARHAYHLYCMQIDTEAFGGRSRDDVLAALRAEGVPCSPGYTTPLSEQEALRLLRERYPDSHRVEPSPVTERVCAKAVWLTQGMLLAERADMDQIVEAFAKVQRAFHA